MAVRYLTEENLRQKAAAFRPAAGKKQVLTGSRLCVTIALLKLPKRLGLTLIEKP